MPYVEILGGPQDGKSYGVSQLTDVLVIPETSSSIEDWLLEGPELMNPMPTFKEVRYRVAVRNGKLYAIHPGVWKA